MDPKEIVSKEPEGGELSSTDFAMLYKEANPGAVTDPEKAHAEAIAGNYHETKAAEAEVPDADARVNADNLENTAGKLYEAAKDL